MVLTEYRYGVRGIPSLVILDALSGGIVVAASETRGEVNYACRMGDDGIDQMFKSWLQRVPEESQVGGILTCANEKMSSNPLARS